MKCHLSHAVSKRLLLLGETTALQFFTLGKHITTKAPTLVVTDMPGYGFAFMKNREAKRCFYLVSEGEDILTSVCLTVSRCCSLMVVALFLMQCSEYLRNRGRRLKRVLLLLDARHGFKLTDLQCLQDLVTMNYTGPEEQEELEEEGEEGCYDKSKKAAPRDSRGVPRQEVGTIRVSWKLQVILTKCDLVERSELARRVHLTREQLSDSLPFLRTSNMPVLMVSALESRGVVELHKELASLVPPSASGNTPADSRGRVGSEEVTVLK